MAVLVCSLVPHDGDFLVCKIGTSIDDSDLCLGIRIDCNIVTLDLFTAEFNASVDTESNVLAVQILKCRIVIIEAVENQDIRSVIENAPCSVEGCKVGVGVDNESVFCGEVCNDADKLFSIFRDSNLCRRSGFIGRCFTCLGCFRGFCLLSRFSCL